MGKLHPVAAVSLMHVPILKKQKGWEGKREEFLVPVTIIIRVCTKLKMTGKVLGK